MPANLGPPSRRDGLSASRQALLQRRLEHARRSVDSDAKRSEEITPMAGLAGELSPGQEGLWLMAQLQPDNPAYHRPVSLQLTGVLEREALQTALNEVLRRHSVLRSRIQPVGGAPRLTIGPPGPFLLEWVDLSTLPEEQRSAAVAQIGEALIQQRFDLEDGPLARGSLIRRAADEHCLLLVFHHLAFDAWSERVLVGELQALYAAFAAGRPSPLAELSIQYADYAAWQLRKLRSGVLDADIAGWQERLAGAPRPLALLPDRRAAGPAWTAARLHTTLSADLVARLEVLARRQNATLAMILLAGYLAALHTFTAQDDALIGLLAAGRSPVETESLLGLFVNTLPLRVDLSGKPGFAELLTRVRQAALFAYARQELPFVELARRAALARDPGSPPLRTVFNFENLPEAGAPVGVDATAVSWSFGAEIDPGAAIYDLSLELCRGPDGLEATWVYRTGLYRAASIERLSDAFFRILEGAADHPDWPVGRLLCPDEETRRAWLATGQPESRLHPFIPLHTQIAAQAERHADSPALVFEDGRLSFVELLDRAAVLTNALQAQGVRPGQRVALLLERSPEMVTALLAVLQAGAVFVPLDPEHPPERLAAILADCRPAQLIVSPALAARLPAGDLLQGCRLFPLSDTAGKRAPQSHTQVQVGLQSPAYVIYTSGSTGRPKGVVVSHGALSNHAGWSQRVFCLGSHDVVLHSTSLAFDMALFEILDALATGAQVVLARPGGQRDPAYLVERMQSTGVTIIQMTPALLEMVGDQDGFPACTALRHILCGGEAMPLHLPEKLRARSRAELHNLYGPTEACNDATHWRCIPGWDGATIPIGYPIDNTQAYVLDRDRAPVPPGAPGELYLGGAGLALGYLNRPDLTAEKFVPNLSKSPKSKAGEGTLDPGPWISDFRLYATGDRVRWLPDGSLEFLGRMDRQVKLRGYRVELGEIETALLRLPGVRQAAVLLQTSGPDQASPYLAAYLAADPDAWLELPALRRALSGRLPEYMLPAACVWRASLPLTPSGKLDVAALRRLPLPASRLAGTEPDLAASPLEKVLAGLWAAVLDLPFVNLDGDFFELGGHSLLAINLAARLSDLLGVDAALRQLYSSPTPRSFAAGLALDGDRLKRTAELLLHLAELPDEDVATLLSQSRASEDGL